MLGQWLDSWAVHASGTFVFANWLQFYHSFAISRCLLTFISFIGMLYIVMLNVRSVTFSIKKWMKNEWHAMPLTQYSQHSAVLNNVCICDAAELLIADKNINAFCLAFMMLCTAGVSMLLSVDIVSHNIVSLRLCSVCCVGLISIVYLTQCTSYSLFGFM